MSSQNSTFLPRRLATAYFGAGTYRIMLVSAVPTEAQIDAWEFRSQVLNEVTGTGYSAGGVPVTLTVGAVDTANNRVNITPTNLTPALATATVSAVGGWIYRDMGSAAADELVQFVDFNETVSSTNGPFNITFSTPIRITAVGV